MPASARPGSGDGSVSRNACRHAINRARQQAAEMAWQLLMLPVTRRRGNASAAAVIIMTTEAAKSAVGDACGR